MKSLHTMKSLHAFLVAFLAGFAVVLDAAAIPFPAALDAAAVEQTPMTPEIPGSLILGNGDLNGILWYHHGQLRFTITKNDACDGRLETAQDPELVRIDVANHKWTTPPGCENPPSWKKPYPCPLICGHILFGTPDPAGWSVVQGHPQASVRYDANSGQAVATIAGRSGNTAGDSAAWGFVPQIPGDARKITARCSGSTNASWCVELPGTGVRSDWQKAQPEATDVELEIPSGKKLTQLAFHVRTDDGKPAEVRLHSVMAGGEAQSLAGADSIGNSGCSARLDVARAAGTVIRRDGEKLTGRVLAQRNVALFETREKVALAPCSAKFIPPSTRGRQRGVEWVLTKVPNDEDWPGMSFALAHASQDARHAVAVVTSLEAKDPVAAAVQLAEEALAEDATKQVAAHEAVWREFWSASGVALADGYLEATWYRNLYFLRCCSKPGVPPIGLFIGCAFDEMPWHGAPTTDYNFEQTFWGAFVCNHAELAEPYNRLLIEYLPRGKWFAKETYGLDGVHYPVNHFAHQINDPAVCKSRNRHMNFYLPWSYVPGANGWQAHNVWLAYLHHPDTNYLKNTVYPLVKEMAIFYADFLEHCGRSSDGKANYGPSYSPEHRKFGVDNTPCDIAWTRFTLNAAIRGATTLACDGELVPRWRAALALVPDYPRTSKTTPPVIADVRGGEPITYNCPVPAMPVFPAGEVNWFSPAEEKEIFARTIQSIKTNGYNSVIMLAGARARLSLPGTHAWIARSFQRRQMPGGFLTLIGDYRGGRSEEEAAAGGFLIGDYRGNYVEQVAASGIVSELLMQSVGDIIRVFPAWPRELDAKFANLSAQGGFLVGAEQKSGKVTRLEITSTVGGKLRLFNPWTGEIIERETKLDEHMEFEP